MTLNELIAQLQELAEAGHGEMRVCMTARNSDREILDDEDIETVGIAAHYFIPHITIG